MISLLEIAKNINESEMMTMKSSSIKTKRVSLKK